MSRTEFYEYVLMRAPTIAITLSHVITTFNREFTKKMKRNNYWKKKNQTNDTTQNECLFLALENKNNNNSKNTKSSPTTQENRSECLYKQQWIHTRAGEK